jgi:hypothetical protein
MSFDTGSVVLYGVSVQFITPAMTSSCFIPSSLAVRTGITPSGVLRQP